MGKEKFMNDHNEQLHLKREERLKDLLEIIINSPNGMSAKEMAAALKTSADSARLYIKDLLARNLIAMSLTPADNLGASLTPADSLRAPLAPVDSFGVSLTQADHLGVPLTPADKGAEPLYGQSLLTAQTGTLHLASDFAINPS